MKGQPYAAEERLDDGSVVIIRSVRRDDADDFLKAFEVFDKESVYRRFFTQKRELTRAEAKALTDIDFERVAALVVTLPGNDKDQLIAGGRFITSEDSPKIGELAFMTAQSHRRKGLASLVLRHLVEIAKTRGLMKLQASVLAENRPMLSVFQNSGLPMSQSRDGNVIEITLSLS